MNAAESIDVVPGRHIEFKKTPGKGRPSLAKALAVDGDNVTVILNDGRLDQIRKNLVTRVIKQRGRAAISELEKFAAKGFQEELAA